MFRRLYARLALVLALLLVLIGGISALFALNASAMFFQELDQRFNRDLARQLIVQRDLVGVPELDAGSVKSLFAHYMHVNPAIEIYLLDLEGRITAYEAPEMRIKRHAVDLEPIRRFLDGSPLPILGDDPRQTEGRKVFSAAAFPFDGPPRQYLYVVLGGEAFDSVRDLVQDSYLVRFSLGAVAAVVLFGVLSGALAFALLTRRLRRLADVMDAFRAGGFRNPLKYSDSGSDDEIDRLGRTFEAMARRIGAQMTALEEKDTLRRNLVANVSHDLRTPLTALQGYLETLQLKGAELTPEQRAQYLAIAHRQSAHLGRLIEELFELSKLDAAETRPELEPVAIGELLVDVAQKYRLQAEERQLQLETSVEEGLPLVRADVAMMDRVLGNLLENACRHTPDGGRVRLSAERCGEGVRLTVANSGEQIPGDALPHLFERFYQSPDGRSGSAGLGLAIVKRILDLHHSPIEVHSDSETRFRFTLAV